MADKKTTTFARNPEQVARAMGLNLSPRKRKGSLAIVNGWIEDKTFPKKTPKGWVLAQVREWKEKQKHPTTNIQQPTSNGGIGKLPAQDEAAGDDDLFLKPATEEQKKLRLAAQFRKWQEAKSSRKDDLDLLAAGLITMEQAQVAAATVTDEPTAVEPELSRSTIYDATGKLRDCGSLEALGIHLALHFKGRVKVDFSEQHLSEWKGGKGVPVGPDGLPLVPPPKLGNRIKAQEWADWFERVMMAKYGLAAIQGAQGTMDIYTRAGEAEAMIKIRNERIKGMEEDVMMGRWGPVAKFRLARLGALKVQHNIFRRCLENDDCRTRSDWLKAHLAPEKLLEFQEFDKGLARNRVDFVEAEYLRVRAEEPERAIVREETAGSR